MLGGVTRSGECIVREWLEVQGPGGERRNSARVSEAEALRL